MADEQKYKLGLDLSSLGSLTSNIGSLLPSGSQLAENIALGAATSVVLAGVKSQGGQDALDPLHLFHKDAPPATPTQLNNPNVVIGPTITASAFASLPPATQAQLAASGVHIVAG
jgi:hypothetical protein